MTYNFSIPNDLALRHYVDINSPTTNRINARLYNEVQKRAAARGLVPEDSRMKGRLVFSEYLEPDSKDYPYSTASFAKAISRLKRQKPYQNESIKHHIESSDIDILPSIDGEKLAKTMKFDIKEEFDFKPEPPIYRKGVSWDG